MIDILESIFSKNELVSSIVSFIDKTGKKTNATLIRKKSIFMNIMIG
jgi:hypothetical protein